MNYSIAATMRGLWSPRHELSCSWLLWRRLIASLRERGRCYTRESGAFLLGHAGEGRVRVTDFMLYDDLDPDCLDSGIVRFDGGYYGALWDYCATRKVSVVADVHVHPDDSMQSHSDRAHPMIPVRGHIALILPRYARSPLRRRDMGIHRYEGSKAWYRVPASAARQFFFIGV
jgi:proteasome lid subunit RPN8/RPN11